MTSGPEKVVWTRVHIDLQTGVQYESLKKRRVTEGGKVRPDHVMESAQEGWDDILLLLCPTLETLPLNLPGKLPRKP